MGLNTATTPLTGDSRPPVEAPIRMQFESRLETQPVFEGSLYTRGCQSSTRLPSQSLIQANFP
jgi:hypothetical protein